VTITAQIIADSVSPAGKRITTMQLRYPRFIHAEFMTHRAFSRNASSSRAIPVAKMIEDLRRDPAMPIYWGSNKPGMQAGAELEKDDRVSARLHWLDGMEEAIERAEHMIGLGLHKQIANRILEPWAHINVVVTATEWANFFNLRCHPDAQPEIQELARQMEHQRLWSTPSLVVAGQWHLPYVDMQADWEAAIKYLSIGRITRDRPHVDEIFNVLRKVSTARCARVSYLTHDGRKTGLEEDIELHNRLVIQEPLHASPAEHQATPDEVFTYTAQDGGPAWKHPELHGNLVGWCQYRKCLPGEYVPG
jgi:thymidylate synthase ThyX